MAYGKLRKLGIDVAKPTVGCLGYARKNRHHTHVEDLFEALRAGPGGPGFLCRADGNTQRALRAADLDHERGRVVHINVIEHPKTAWTAQQVIDAFPWDEVSRYLLRDRTDEMPPLDFIHSRGITKGLGQAVQQGTRDFHHIGFRR
jgi:hypothetical protein